MMKKLMIFLTVLFVAAQASQAMAAQCYSRSEAEAEQAIRIHSELMVIGLNCMNMRFRDGTNLYRTYHNFTRANSDMFQGYEQTLVDYFRKAGHDQPERSLDTLRTVLANNISNSAARMKPDQFCNRYAGRVLQASGMDRSTLRQWASTFHPSHPVSRPICE